MAGNSNIHILVAEDNESHRRVSKLMLTRLGYDSDVVPNAFKAIQAVNINHYDLVLMDLVMPGMDGLQAAREIRKLGKGGLKILAVTAYVVPGIREICLEAGMDDCITKPVRIGELAEVLKKFAYDSQSSAS